MKKKLLILGWDAADWQVINELRSQGLLPALERVLQKASKGALETMEPAISPMLWTSIGTGVAPEKHGILGFVEPTNDGSGIRPLFSTSRKVKAFWNMMNQYGLKCNIVGWWPSFPAEPIDGVIVSNFYQMITGQDPEQWPMQAGTIHPSHLEKELASLRVHPHEITPAMVFPFVPLLDKLPEEESKVIGNLRSEIAKAASIQAASTWLMQNTEWDVMAVYYDFIDHLSHMGMRFRPPQLKGVPDDKFNYYKDMVNGAYRFQDMMLDRMLDLIDDSTAIMILSDHGFESGAMRPLAIPLEPAGPTSEHSHYGILAFSGPGIAQREILGASVIDITPTILHYFGLPVAKDMDGKVLQSCFSEPKEPLWIDSWETHDEGGFPSGMHPVDKRESTWSSREALEQLIELGYIERPEGTNEEVIAKAKAEVDYYLAQSLSFRKMDTEAVVLLEKIIALFPDFHRYRTLAIQCYIRTRNWGKAMLHIEALSGKDQVLDLKALFFKGKIAQSQHRPMMAVRAFDEALKIAPNAFALRYQKALVLNSMGKYKEATDLLHLLHHEDPRNPEVLFSLGFAAEKTGDYESGADYFLSALEFKPTYIVAHYHLAECLRALGEYPEAAMAYEQAVQLSPGLFRARSRLIDLYKNQVKDETRAKVHENWMIDHSLYPVYCVSGLPGAGIEELTEDLLSKGISVKDFRDKTDPEQRAELDLDEVKSMKDGVVVLNHAQLMRLPDQFPLKLIWLDAPDNILLNRQLELSGQYSKLRDKVYPTQLAELNLRQRNVFSDWKENRSQLTYLESPGITDREEMLNQALGFFDLF